MRVFLGLVFAIIALPAVAQSDGHEWMLEDLRACYQAADSIDAKRDCVGIASNKCQETEDGGYSTLGIASCTYDESQAWDVLLNEEYKTTVGYFTEWDLDEAEYNENFARRVETLREAQRAWIAFRDAECELAFAIWGSGSHRSIAGAACLLDETAERTIDLWVMQRM